MTKLCRDLQKLARELEISLFGVADISAIKEEIRIAAHIKSKLERAVVLGMRVSTAILDEIENYPTKLYFHHYRTLNTCLDQAALRIAAALEEKGFYALAIPASQILDWQKQTSHLSHKKMGYLAGLGWLGRNNLLVNKKIGSQFRLVTVLTNAPLKAGRPVREGCGECVSCISVCPAGAIKQNAADFDHLACFAKLKEFQQKKLADQYICGICVKACRKSAKEYQVNIEKT